jgi:hypothetical protein
MGERFPGSAVRACHLPRARSLHADRWQCHIALTIENICTKRRQAGTIARACLPASCVPARCWHCSSRSFRAQDSTDITRDAACRIVGTNAAVRARYARKVATGSRVIVIAQDTTVVLSGYVSRAGTTAAVPVRSADRTGSARTLRANAARHRIGPSLRSFETRVAGIQYPAPLPPGPLIGGPTTLAAPLCAVWHSVPRCTAGSARAVRIVIGAHTRCSIDTQVP